MFRIVAIFKLDFDKHVFLYTDTPATGGNFSIVHLLKLIPISETQVFNWLDIENVKGKKRIDETVKGVLENWINLLTSYVMDKTLRLRRKKRRSFLDLKKNHEFSGVHQLVTFMRSNHLNEVMMSNAKVGNCRFVQKCLINEKLPLGIRSYHIICITIHKIMILILTYWNRL